MCLYIHTSVCLCMYLHMHTWDICIYPKTVYGTTVQKFNLFFFPKSLTFIKMASFLLKVILFIQNYVSVIHPYSSLELWFIHFHTNLLKGICWAPTICQVLF